MKLLFVSYGGGHIEMVLPVIRVLRARHPGIDIRLMALTTAARIARQAGEAPLGYADFLTGPQAESARAWGERLLPGNQHPDVAREESVAYLGLNYMEWVAKDGESAALARWQAQGRHGFLPVCFFRRVLQELQPDAVVATNSPRSEAAVVAAAASLGIPSLSMLDLFGLCGDPFLARGGHADTITVLSQGVKDNLMRAGLPAGRIVITGNPAFDALVDPGAQAQGRAWRAARGWEGKRVLLWAGHREPDDADPAWAGTALGNAVLQRLLRWLDADPGRALAVRYHPNEWQDFEQPPVHPHIHWSQPGEEPLVPVLLGADQVLVQGTTVGVQAYTAGKPLLSLGFSPFVQRSGMDYAALGMARRADSLDALAALLDEDLPPPAAAEAGHGRPAADAVADCIEALAARPRRAAD